MRTAVASTNCFITLSTSFYKFAEVISVLNKNMKHARVIEFMLGIIVVD